MSYFKDRASANLWKPIHDVENYSTFIYNFESGKCGKEGEKFLGEKIKNSGTSFKGLQQFCVRLGRGWRCLGRIFLDFNSRILLDLLFMCKLKDVSLVLFYFFFLSLFYFSNSFFKYLKSAIFLSLVSWMKRRKRH